MFFKSIRFRMLIWYTILLAITLSSFGFILYEGFDKTLYNDLDDLLSARAEGIADSINAYWHTKKTEALELENFVEVARSWVEEKRKDPELMSIFAQILDKDEEVLVSSKAMPRITKLSKDDFKDIIDGEDSFDTVEGGFTNGKETKFRMYSRPVTEGGSVKYVVQVIAPANLISVALGDLKFMLLVLVPLIILLAGIPGILLVGITFRPVDKMIATLKQITAENLKLKIHIPDTKDEVKKLADTFNDMIDRLDRSFSSQQRFIQDISHELKTPMNILQEEIGDVLAKTRSADEYKTVLKKVSESINSFSRVIEEDLLTISRLDDNMMLEIKKINLARLIKRVLDEVKILTDKKELVISFSCPDTIIMDGDENKLARLFLELFDNAIKYTYRNGRITVAALKDGEFAKIAVSDTGSGISEYDLPYIFDRFYKAGKAGSAKDGFGLGLSNVKSIVEAHKGSIAVESEPGKGSTFTVSLPVSYPG